MSAPSLARFGALTGTYFAAIGLFNPYAPLWFQSLGFSTLVIGAIASLQSWTRVVAPYAWSWGGDHTGRRVELIRLATLGAVLSSLGLLAVQAMQPMGATELVVAVALMTALRFVANSGVVSMAGLIGTNTDQDWFTFSTDGGTFLKFLEPKPRRPLP